MTINFPKPVSQSSPAPVGMDPADPGQMQEPCAPTLAAASESVFNGGFFVVVGDGTCHHSLAHEASACRHAAESALGGLAGTVLQSGNASAASSLNPAAADPDRAVVEEAVARQEKSLCNLLGAMVSNAFDLLRFKVQQSMPDMVSKGLELGVKTLASAGLQQLNIGLQKDLADELGRILVPVLARGAGHISEAMKSCLHDGLQMSSWQEPSFDDGFNHLLQS